MVTLCWWLGSILQKCSWSRKNNEHTVLHEICCRFGLNISFQKTKKQVFNNEELANMPTLFAINGEVIENVSDSRTLLKFSAIRNKKTSMYYVYQKQLESLMKWDKHKVRKATRKKLMEAYVRSRLTYRTQTWYIHQGRLSEETGELLDGNVKADGEGRSY